MYNFKLFPQRCITLVNNCISDIKLVLTDSHRDYKNDVEFHDFIISIIQREPLCLQYIEHPTLDMFVAASRYAGALSIVENQSPEIVNFAVKKNKFNMYQLNHNGIKSLQEICKTKIGNNYNGFNLEEICAYTFANLMQQSILNVCINIVLKKPIINYINFTFFCLRHNLTYRSANEILKLGDSSLAKQMEKEIPEFCNFIKNWINIECIIPEDKTIDDLVDHRLEIWHPTIYDRQFVPRPVRTFKNEDIDIESKKSGYALSRELLIDEIKLIDIDPIQKAYGGKVEDLRIKLIHNVDNRFKLTKVGVLALIQLYKRKTGLDLSRLTWIPSYWNASKIQREIIDIMTYRIGDSFVQLP